MNKTVKNILILITLIVSTALFAQQTSSNLDYRPSIVSSLGEVEEAFKTLRGDDRDKSQCFYRAHTWCHDMERVCNIKSSKIFIFYSPRYQKEVDKKWWFHVAPMVTGKDADGNIVEYVFDKTFNTNIAKKDVPVTVADWTKFFARGRACKDISNFQEFLDDKKLPLEKQAYCYIRKTPMYAFSPADVESCDCANPPVIRTEWNEKEVKDAGLAFGKENSVRYFFHRMFGR